MAESSPKVNDPKELLNDYVGGLGTRIISNQKAGRPEIASKKAKEVVKNINLLQRYLGNDGKQAEIIEATRAALVKDPEALKKYEEENVPVEIRGGGFYLDDKEYQGITKDLQQKVIDTRQEVYKNKQIQTNQDKKDYRVNANTRNLGSEEDPRLKIKRERGLSEAEKSLDETLKESSKRGEAREKEYQNELAKLRQEHQAKELAMRAQIEELQRLNMENAHKAQEFSEKILQVQKEGEERLKKVQAELIATRVEEEQLNTPPPERQPVQVEEVPQGFNFGEFARMAIDNGRNFLADNWSMLTALSIGAGGRLIMSKVLEMDMATADFYWQKITGLGIVVRGSLFFGGMLRPWAETLPVVGNRIKEVNERFPNASRRISNVVNHVLMASAGYMIEMGAEGLGNALHSNNSQNTEQKQETKTEIAIDKSNQPGEHGGRPPVTNAENLTSTPWTSENKTVMWPDHFTIDHPDSNIWNSIGEQLTSKLGLGADGQTMFTDAVKDVVKGQYSGAVHVGDVVNFDSETKHKIGQRLLEAVQREANTGFVNMKGLGNDYDKLRQYGEFLSNVK